MSAGNQHQGKPDYNEKPNLSMTPVNEDNTKDVIDDGQHIIHHSRKRVHDSDDTINQKVKRKRRQEEPDNSKPSKTSNEHSERSKQPMTPVNEDNTKDVIDERQHIHHSRKRVHDSDDTINQKVKRKRQQEYMRDSPQVAHSNYSTILHRNFKRLKEEIDIEHLVTQFQKQNIVLRIDREESRASKVVNLLSQIEQLIETENSKTVFEAFVCALKESNTTLAKELEKPCLRANNIHDFDGYTKLLEQFQDKREEFMQNVEPLQFIDGAVENEGVTFTECYDISKQQSRQKRAEMLFKLVDELQEEDKWKILQVMPFHSAEGNDTPVHIAINRPRGEIPAMQETQTPVNLTSELNDIRTTENIDIEVINKIIEKFYRQFDISAKLKNITMDSIHFHLTISSTKDVEKIKHLMMDNKFNSLLEQMLGELPAEMLHTLGRKMANFSVYIGNSKTECLCFLNKKTCKENIDTVTELLNGIEIEVIDRLIQTKLLSLDTCNDLIRMKNCEEQIDLKTEMVEFLVQENLQQICFCFLESFFLEKKPIEWKQIVEKQEHEDINFEISVPMTSKILMSNKELLADELDAKWFLDTLSRRTDKQTIQLVTVIKSSTTRADRTTPFIEFLCMEPDLSWFESELISHNKYLHDKLSRKINQNQVVVKEMKRVLIVLSDTFEEDLEPLEIRKYLDGLSEEFFKELAKETSRRKRASIFLQTIVRDKKETTIPAVIEAMKNGYNELVELVKDVVEKGSLSRLYKCPRIQYPSEFHSCLDISQIRSDREGFTHEISTGIQQERKQQTGSSVTEFEYSKEFEWRVRFVKQYSLMKEELSRSSALKIAKYLLEKNFFTRDNVESISNSSRRRKAVDKLLKLVLNDTIDMFNVFKAALQTFEVSLVLKSLDLETTSDEEVKVFNLLENSQEKGCQRPNNQEERLTFTESAYQSLKDEISERNLIDKINDQLLTRQIISIHEHTNIARCSFKKGIRLQQLLATLELCAETVLLTFIEILESFEMNHVAEMLGEMQNPKDDEPTIHNLLNSRTERRVVNSLRKRQTSSQQKETELTTSNEDDDCRSRESYRTPGASLEKSDSNSSLNSLEHLGFHIEDVRTGSIIIMMRPKGPHALQNLKTSCETGTIKNLIPELFADNELHQYFKEGEYIIALTIYIVSANETPDIQTYVLCLENEDDVQGKTAEELQTQRHVDVLLEELEITDDILAYLKKRNIVNDDIDVELSAQKSRREKIKYLLRKLKANKSGFEIFKDYLRDTNNYLYRCIVENDDAVTSKKTTGYSKDDIVFSCTIVLKIKKREAVKVQEDESQDFVITCPTILNKVSNFKGKGVKKGKYTKTSAKKCPDKETTTEGEGHEASQQQELSTQKKNLQ